MYVKIYLHAFQKFSRIQYLTFDLGEIYNYIYVACTKRQIGPHYHIKTLRYKIGTRKHDLSWIYKLKPYLQLNNYGKVIKYIKWYVYEKRQEIYLKK